MSKVLMKFTKGHGKYNKGEIAGFDKATAEKLYKAKVAQEYTAPEGDGDGGDEGGTDETGGAKKQAGKKANETA